MPTCQCPACQAQFQAAADRGAFTACPECLFKVRVPELSESSLAAKPRWRTKAGIILAILILIAPLGIFISFLLAAFFSLRE